MSEAPDTRDTVDIADLRRRLGEKDRPISQTELARRCSINQSTISRWEDDPSAQKGPILVLLQKIDEETPEPDWADAVRSRDPEQARAS